MKRVMVGLIGVLILSVLPAQQTRGQSEGGELSPADINDRLAGITENLTTLNGDVAILKWLKVGGYVQARYEMNDTSRTGDSLVRNIPTNRNGDNLYIRRGRIKFTFQPAQSSKYVLNFDASRNSISMREAYLELYKQVKKHSFSLTAGQFNLPFGYEIEYSSSRRDFPERSLAENRLFPGERDRGLNITYTAPRTFAFNVGVFQGGGIDAPWNSPLRAKDFVARAKMKLGMVDFGLSGYWGNSYVASVPAVIGSSTWFDGNGNSQVDSGEVTTTQPKAAVPGAKWDRERLGADMQFYFDLIPVGSTALRAEFFKARDYNRDVKTVVDERGWYLWLSQSLGKNLGAAARYDFWSPNTALANNATGTWSFAAHYFYDANVRITAAYDIPQLLAGKSTFSKSPNDRADNRFTLQFQFAI